MGNDKAILTSLVGLNFPQPGREHLILSFFSICWHHFLTMVSTDLTENLDSLTESEMCYRFLCNFDGLLIAGLNIDLSPFPGKIR